MAGLTHLELLTDFFNRIGPITTCGPETVVGRFRRIADVTESGAVTSYPKDPEGEELHKRQRGSERTK